MTGSPWDYLVLAIITAGIIIAIWKGGAANPVSTGRLVRRLDKVEADVVAQGHQIADVETRLGKAVSAVEASVEQLRGEVATKADLRDLSRAIEGERALSERTWSAIDRMQTYFIEHGIGRRA